MAFDRLPPQPPLDHPRAEAYAAAALARSREAAARTRCVLDVAYGAHAQQRLDVYLPADKALRGLPVLLFFHGGRWTHGYKEWAGLFAPGVVEMPAVLVTADYRLAPGHKFPAPAEDCAAALAWVHRHIAEHGGDPARIHIGGHSAGGHLAALIALRPEFLAAHGLARETIRACFPVSSTLDLVFPEAPAGSEEAGILATLFTRREDAALASPLRYVAGNTTPFYLVYGGRDFPRTMRTSAAMAEALADQPGRSASHVFPDHDHFDMGLKLAEPDGPWMRTVREWMTGRPAGSDDVAPGPRAVAAGAPPNRTATPR